jgi:hypothetical protein
LNVNVDRGKAAWPTAFPRSAANSANKQEVPDEHTDKDHHSPGGGTRSPHRRLNGARLLDLALPPADQPGDIGAKGTCSKSFKTYIRRITELVEHHHPKRRWTSLPAFSNCNQSTPEERNHTALKGLAGGAIGGAAAAAGVAALSGNGSSSSAAVSRSLPVYSERDDAHIPEHDECTSVIPVYRRDVAHDDEEIVGYQCRAWKHVEDHYELGKECDLYGYDGSPAKYSRFVSEEDLFLYECDLGMLRTKRTAQKRG